MTQSTDQRQYRIIGAYDSETNNVREGIQYRAYPILHQLAILDAPIETITAENVEEHTHVHLYRETLDLYEKLDDLVNETREYIPVLLCHNLAFDMYGLSAWLNEYDVTVLAKSQTKPIKFEVMEGDSIILCIWDTLIFTQQSLDYMGKSCGYHKLVGSWDYDLPRTPKTPLTDSEKAYALHDCHALLAYMGYWLRLNPDIAPAMLANRVVTKTGVVRVRRVLRYSNLRGRGRAQTVGVHWRMMNNLNTFKSDDELYTCIASTRGGFTFCASKSASVPYDLDETEVIAGYDATSQHPAQIASHYYPSGFKKATGNALTHAFNIISRVTLDDMLDKWKCPFHVAFYGLFEFENLRLKAGTVFEREGIPCLASARFGRYKIDETVAYDNQTGEEYREYIAQCGYKDTAEDASISFGKLSGAKSCRIYLTELGAWEVSRVYDYDNVHGISGYMTFKFARPSDMALLSVMGAYHAKAEFKGAMSEYESSSTITNAAELEKCGIPRFVIDDMKSGNASGQVIKDTMRGLKSDLNSLYGIEACNEYRRETELTDLGITYMGDFGIANKPKKPKAFYQMGQRIVGWSRVAQVCVMELIAPYALHIVNGDTDSVKVHLKRVKLPGMEQELKRYAKALEKAKNDVCGRIKQSFPAHYDALDGIGAYVREFETRRFCASWNKAYIMEQRGKLNFTIAGVPCGHGVENLANRLHDEGMSFGAITDVFLGYNVTYAPNITNLLGRSCPEWGSMYIGDVIDHTGAKTRVVEPAALSLYPMPKTVNDTALQENETNMLIALRNRPSVNVEPVIITRDGIVKTGDLIG